MNRKISFLFALMLTLLIGFSCKENKGEIQTPEQSNILANSNFNNDLSEWIVEQSNGASAQAYNDNGNACMKITRPSPPSNVWLAFGQEVRSKMTIGKKYILSIRYKVLSGEDVKLIVRLSTSQLASEGECITNDDCIQLLTSDNNWHTITIQYTESDTISRADRPNLGIYSDYNCSQETAEFLIDDVTMLEVQE